MIRSYEEVWDLGRELVPWERLPDEEQGERSETKGNRISLVTGEKWRNPRTGAVETFDYAIKADGVTVLPITPDGNILLIIQQKPVGGLVLGCPAGIAKDGDTETAVKKALGELEQEAGAKAGNIIETTGRGFRAYPMKVVTQSQTFTAFSALVTKEQNLEAGESSIVVVEVTPATFASLTLAGLVTGETMVAAFLAFLNGHINFRSP